MKYTTYGVKVDSKGNYVIGSAVDATTKRAAAEQRNGLCSEMSGKDRVWQGAITYREGQLYRRQTIPGALA